MFGDNEPSITCGACEEIISLEDAAEEGWFHDIKLTDCTATDMHLCASCAARYLDIDDRMPIQTYEMIRKLNYAFGGNAD